MSYFPDINLYFIHIPKTAGTSITHFLKSKTGNVLYNDSFLNYTTLHKHSPYVRIKEILKEDNIKNMEFFSIIRNPYDRIISSFNYNMSYERRLDKQSDKIIYIQKFLEKFDNIKVKFLFYVLFVVKNNYSYLWNRTLTSYLVDENKNISDRVKILRYENLAEELKNYKPEIFNTELPKEFRHKLNYSKEELFSPQAISLIKNRFYKDFVNFNYRIDQY